MSDEILRIEHLAKSFGRGPVLDDFCLALEAGRVHGLLGANGAGKTTLARALLGVIPRDGGAVVFRGAIVPPGDPGFLRQVGYIPEDPFFYEGMTVRDILAFNAPFYPAWDAARAKAYLDEFELDPRARIRSLSRGQKLKLEFAAAVSARPALLILDDPTSGLDVPTRRGFLRNIVRALADEGTTVLFASHLVHELERVADRVAIMDGGRVTLDEDLAELRARTMRVRLAFEGGVPADLAIPGTRTRAVRDREADLVVHPWTDEAERAARASGAANVEVEPLSLEDIFVAFVS